VACDTPEALKRRHAGSATASLEEVFFQITGRALRETDASVHVLPVRRRRA